MSYITYLTKNWFFILMLAAGAGLLTLGVTLVQQDKYEATTKLLVIQQSQEKIDPYTASKSAENISSVLREVMYTNSFFQSVMRADYFITDNFGVTDEQKLKSWKKTVSVDILKDTGIITVSVYNRDKLQAEQIAHAIANVLVTQGKEYHGGGDDVTIRIIDGPRVSDRTVIPNIPEDTALGFVLGGIGGLLVLVVRYESGKRNIFAAKSPRAFVREAIERRRATLEAKHTQ